MCKYYSLSFLLLTFHFSLLSQSLYTPTTIQNCYDKGTRSIDGKPGPNYWQNRASYKIDVSVDPTTKTVTGSEEIVYTNNSPDNLDRLVFRMYQNIMRSDVARNWGVPKENNTDGIIIDELTVNGKLINTASDSETQSTGTNLIIINLSIAPGSETRVTAKWHFQIPKNGPRMGDYGDSTFFIGYWYPQIGVYDDIDGWDMTEYTGMVEFYNDFNDYDVNITVPNNFCVWSTGVLQNPEDVFIHNIYARWVEAHQSDSVVHIITPQDYLRKMPIFNMKNKTNTWNFKASNVPDFTFAMSSHYLWDGRAADNGDPDKSGQDGTSKVFCSAAYDPKSNDFKEVAYVTAVTVERMSKELPGVPFPYPCITVFNGAGGMESPMMVNQGSSNERIWMVYVTVHEVAHTYFPFYMGINERKYAWMDEGQAQMLMEYIEWGLDTAIDFHQRDVARYLNNSGKEYELPMMIDSRQTNWEAYGNASYFRPSVAYNIMLDMLGKEKYTKCQQEYMRRWNGKHPMPYDYFYSFNDAAGENLNWFFIPWFFEKGYPDLAIKDVRQEGDRIQIVIERIGSLPVPVAMTFNTANGTDLLVYRKADVWRESILSGKDGVKVIIIEEKVIGSITEIKLGTKYIPDVNEKDNVWEKSH